MREKDGCVVVGPGAAATLEAAGPVGRAPAGDQGACAARVRTHVRSFVCGG